MFTLSAVEKARMRPVDRGSAISLLLHAGSVLWRIHLNYYEPWRIQFNCAEKYAVKKCTSGAASHVTLLHLRRLRLPIGIVLLLRLEAKRQADIRGDGRGLVDQPVEKGPWLEAGKVECDDGVRHRNSPNLEISLIAEIAGMAGTGRINQGSTPKSINPILG